MTQRIRAEFARRCRMSGLSYGIRREKDGTVTVTHRGRSVWEGTLADAMRIAGGFLPNF
jgi:hypothetical protein